MLFLLFACNDPCAPGPDPTLDIGLGLDSFTPTEDGDSAELTFGQQGGFHIDLALESTELDAGDLVSGQLSGTVDGQEVAGGQPWFNLTCNPNTNTQQVGALRLIFFGMDATEADGRTVEVEAVVRDARGTEATATRSLVIDNAGGGG